MSVQEIPEEIGTPAPEVQATYDDAVRLSDKVVVDGKLDSAVTDETFEVVNPAWLNVIGSSPRCRGAGRRPRRRRGQEDLQVVVAHDRQGTRRAHAQARRPHRGARRRHRPTRSLGDRQRVCDAGAARTRHGHRGAAHVRGIRDRAERQHRALAQRHAALHHARPDRGGRRDHPVERADPAVGLQDRSRHRGRQHGRPEDRRAGAPRSAEMHRTRAAGAPARRGQHHLGHGRGMRPTARRAQGCTQDHVHRVVPGGAPDHALRGGQDLPRDAGARRQEPPTSSCPMPISIWRSPASSRACGSRAKDSPARPVRACSCTRRSRTR